ncbi:MAG: hypothetical protein AAGM67_16095, partial [Bacteroidota bacterium]
RVVFIHKFRADHPDYYQIITIRENQGASRDKRTYVLQGRDGKLSHPQHAISLTSSPTGSTIAEYLNGDTIVHQSSWDLESLGSISVGFSHQIHSISLKRDDLSLTLGVEKLLYRILDLTNKTQEPQSTPKP